MATELTSSNTRLIRAGRRIPPVMFSLLCKYCSSFGGSVICCFMERGKVGGKLIIIGEWVEEDKHVVELGDECGLQQNISMLPQECL